MALVALMGCAKLTTLEIEERCTTPGEQGTLLEELLGNFGFESFVTMDLTASLEMQNQGAPPGRRLSPPDPPTAIRWRTSSARPPPPAARSAPCRR